MAALSLTGSQWIWTAAGRTSTGVYPVGNATFRRDYTPPDGKIPLSATFLMVADDAFKLYVDGATVGDGSVYSAAQRFCTPLVSSNGTVFAVNAYNNGGPAGLVAAVRVIFIDGQNETFITDAAWRAVMGVPAGFAEVSFDDSAWPAAFTEGAFPNTSPWSGQVSIPADLPYVGPASDPPPALQSADWVWTNQYKQAIVGARAFRKTIVFPAGQPVDSLIIDIIVDDAYSLYLNGLFVGSGQSYTTAQRWQVIFAPTLTVVIAVYAKNTGGGPRGYLPRAS